MSNDEKVYVRPKITRHILVEYHITKYNKTWNCIKRHEMLICRLRYMPKYRSHVPPLDYIYNMYIENVSAHPSLSLLNLQSHLRQKSTVALPSMMDGSYRRQLRWSKSSLVMCGNYRRIFDYKKFDYIDERRS